MPLRLPLIAALALAGCEDATPPAADGFTFGEPVACPAPTDGLPTYSDVAGESGLTEPLTTWADVFGGEGYGRGGGLVVADLDDDGDLDVATARLDGPPDVYFNDGDARFQRLSPALDLPIDRARRPLGLGAADLDGDRLPELILVGQGFVAAYRSTIPGRWAEPELLYAEGFAAPQVYLTFALGDLNGDGPLDLVLPGTGTQPAGAAAGSDESGSPDLVLLGDGAGFGAPVASLVVAAAGSTTQVALVTDRDDDGDGDVFVPADLGPPSGFWRNDGDLRFVDDAAAIGADLAMAAMGIDSADLDGDALPDYCISDVGPPRCLLSAPGAYVEASAALGVVPADPVGTRGTVGWGLDLADLDNDGFVELLQASGPDIGTARAGDTELPDLLFRGGEGGFVDVTAEVGFGDVDDDYGLATADLNGDGALDIVLAGPGRPPKLYLGACTDHAWLEVELVGPPGNTEGFGARASITAGGRTWVRELHALRGPSQGPSRVHVGLGDVDRVERIEVRWPDGRVDVAEDIEPRRVVTAVHPDAVAPSRVAPPPPPDGHVRVAGDVLDPDAGEPRAGARIEAEAGVATRSDAGGAFTLWVPPEPVTLVASGDGLSPVHAPIDPRWQRRANDGLSLPLMPRTELDAFYAGLLQLPRDPAAGSVLVSVLSPDGEPVVGAEPSLSVPYAAAALLGDEGETPGTVVRADTRDVFFGNVEAGTVTLTVSTPDGAACRGRTTFDVVAEAVTVVRAECE